MCTSPNPYVGLLPSPRRSLQGATPCDDDTARNQVVLSDHYKIRYPARNNQPLLKNPFSKRP